MVTENRSPSVSSGNLREEYKVSLWDSLRLSSIKNLIIYRESRKCIQETLKPLKVWCSVHWIPVLRAL